MVIDFKNMDVTVIENFRGGEKSTEAKMFYDGTNRIMLARLVPGASIGLHTHDAGSEIIYVLEGCGKMLYDDSEERLSAGMCHYCLKGHAHSFINDSEADLVFFAAIPQQ